MAYTLQSVDFRSNDAPKTVTESLKQTGFAVISNHPIEASLIDEVYGEWERFFASSAKIDYLFDKEKQDGYFPFLSEHAKDYTAKDLKEFYHVYPWGRYPKEISDRTRQLNDQLTELASQLLQWVEEHTPEKVKEKFDVPLSDMIKDSSRNLLRIIHYPPLTGAEEPGAVRAAGHEDINLLTLLPAGTQPGLQVKDTVGNWLEVPCDPGMIIVNTGDMLEMCSGGYYPSTPHRVINPKDSSENASRYSMPLFLHPRDEVRLSETHTAGSYLLERLKEIGLKE